jgi:hypothetical protein
MKLCDICEDVLPPYSGRGRPRVRCEECASDKSGLARRWREMNEEAVETYNERKRIEYRKAALQKRIDEAERFRSRMRGH